MSAACYVQTTGFQAAWDRLRRCHHSRFKLKPLHLRLLGVSGVGKSFLAERYKEAHPNYDEGEATIVPVVHFAIPSTPSKKQMYQAFIKGFGAQSTTGTAEDLKLRAQTLCNACKSEIILIDEVHHFIDRGGARTFTAAGDALKELIDAIKRPVVLIGAPRSKTLFHHNIQLRSRVMSTHRMRPFSRADLGELMGFLYALTSDLPEPVRRWVASQEVAVRIFFATDGIHRNVTTLVAGIQEELAGSTTVNFALLSRVFKEFLWAEPSPGRDPFAKDAPQRRLVDTGEPYEPSPLDGDNHELQLA
jgi:hypothetical protein